VRVGNKIVTNPEARVPHGDPIHITEPRQLRGALKLRAALDEFAIEVLGKIAVDLGASTGGFTSVLLERGAAKVYAVDAGRGQLLARLAADPRVIDLGGTNLGELGRARIEEAVELLTIDVSYLALHRAAPQLRALGFAEGAELVALVKPMFELGRAELPTHPIELEQAVSRAATALSRSGWQIVGSFRSPLAGAKGAIEFFIHARRAATAERA
jgi:23S rRNA (cytidine1920-2'-O)/16S rRNA (cytidine1409-2'-O)-methyltransferase